MGNACCAASEVKGAQKDITEPSASLIQKSSIAEVEEKRTTGAAKESKAPTSEFTIMLKKTEGCNLLGIDVDLGDGVSLVVDDVKEGTGMVQAWNKANPKKAVAKDDRIVAVNGVRGDSVRLAEACKNDAVLEMVVSRIGAGPEP
mmetsp:Transcript_60777/g.170323  ORF Transcript_60777/g.170323 Transcript_60777/m.170323 type:complete len:145 (+) Transcript_60777:172-606(+)